MGLFLAGFVVGGLLGVFCMCLLQVNRYKDD